MNTEPKWEAPDFIVTRAGLKVGIAHAAIDLGDIRTGLAMAPRFAGHTRRPWSVLHHSLVCWRIARVLNADSTTQLQVLLHDAHEAYTGDVPTPFKSPQMKTVQRALDGHIWSQLVGGAPRTDTALVCIVDQRALVAEAIEVGPPSIDESNVEALFGSVPLVSDRRVVLDIVGIDYLDVQSIFQRGAAALIAEVRRAAAL